MPLWQAAGALGLLLAVAAFVVLRSTPASVQPVDCVVGIDISESVVENPDLLDRYKGWAEGVLRECAREGATGLAAFAMTDVTETDTELPVVHEPELDASDNPTNRRREMEEWVDSHAAREIERMVSGSDGLGHGNTDLLAASAVAERFFSPDAERHRVVLITDALNIVPPADTRLPMDAERIDEIISTLTAEGRIRDLDGAEVEMYGVLVGDASDTIPRSQRPGIESMWRRYIEASGGRLAAYSGTYTPPAVDG